MGPAHLQNPNGDSASVLFLDQGVMMVPSERTWYASTTFVILEKNPRRREEQLLSPRLRQTPMPLCIEERNGGRRNQRRIFKMSPSHHLVYPNRDKRRPFPTPIANSQQSQCKTVQVIPIASECKGQYCGQSKQGDVVQQHRIFCSF